MHTCLVHISELLHTVVQPVNELFHFCTVYRYKKTCMLYSAFLLLELIVISCRAKGIILQANNKELLLKSRHTDNDVLEFVA